VGRTSFELGTRTGVRIGVPALLFRDLVHHFEPRVGDWHAGAAVGTYRITYTDIGTYLRAAFYPVFRPLRFDKAGIDIVGAGAAGAVVRLGIYADEDNDFYPDKLIADFGAVPADVTGLQTIDIDLKLDKERYFMVLQSSDGTVDVYFTTVYLPLRVDAPSPAIGGYWVDVPYGPLPDPFPAGAFVDRYCFLARLRVAELL